MALNNNVISLSQTVSSEPSSGTVGDKIEDREERNDPFYNVSSRELMDVVRHVLSGLSEKESAILKLRFGLFDDENLDRQEYSISQEEADDLEKGIALK
jgi:RNA polymerase nonessential primary-like sigma factor